MPLTITDFTIPNLLSIVRIVVAPFLIVAGYAGDKYLFLGLLAAALLTDALDGYLARRLGQTSELGNRLDSLGDFAVYLAVPLALWMLWPELIRRHFFFFGTAVAAFALPILVGLVKYRRLTCYHTWGAKISAVLLAVTTPVLLFGGPAWAFHMAVMILVLAELEEVVITFTLSTWQGNVPSLWHARKLNQERLRKSSG